MKSPYYFIHRRTVIASGKDCSPQAGFTLIELLVAMAVLSVGILGVMNLMIASIGRVGEARDRVIAANLAQEGVEIASNIRNSNWIGGSAYNSGLGEGTWCADAADQNLSACGSYGINWDGSLYTHEEGEATGFERRIVIETGSDGSNSFTRVQSIVSWDEGAQSLTAETHLYDWR